MKNQVQLITYVDRLGGGDLRDLRALLTAGEGNPLRGLFGGVHLLPFFHPIDGADAGFDPIDHTRVDPRLGDWADLAALGAPETGLEVMADVIVNHMSSQSPQFLDYQARGEDSAHAGLFLTLDAVFPEGANEALLTTVYRPRPGLPLTVLQAGDAKRVFWTTFTPQQIDIDVEHPSGEAYLDAILSRFAEAGIRSIRLDAAGYAIKRAGRSCFMMPETFDFIGAFSAKARALGIEVLVEVHSYYRRQIEIARQVDWVYDFALPPLVLHAFAFKTAAPLKAWVGMRPENALTVLDTHDGIGIIDIGADASDRAGSPGLVPPEELDALVEWIHRNSAGESRLATGAAASNLDLYQVNCTFFDALGGSERDYLLARAIQFFMPGIPQVYYVGLLAGRNDLDLLRRTGVGRDINRHRYTRDEIDERLRDDVVRQLLDLIELRNTHPAFSGRFALESGDASELRMSWTSGTHRASLRVDFANPSAHELRFSEPGQADRVIVLGSPVTAR